MAKNPAITYSSVHKQGCNIEVDKPTNSSLTDAVAQ